MSNSRLDQMTSTCLVLTAEFDADIRPQTLDRSTAMALADAVCADLRGFVTGIDGLVCVVAGALYDQTQLLRPDMVLRDALEEVARGSCLGSGFQPQQLSLGTDDGDFSIDALNPLPSTAPSPLLMVPVVLFGPAADVGRISERLEASLLQSVEVSDSARATLQTAVGARLRNASYATLADLLGLLKTQLEANGYAPLWGLLEPGFLGSSAPTLVVSAEGNRYVLTDGVVYSACYTFDDWARIGPGREIPEDELADGYAGWTRRYREMLAGLDAYGLELRQVLGDTTLDLSCARKSAAAMREAAALDGDYLVETVWVADSDAPEAHLSITNQWHELLGTIAYTVLVTDAEGDPLRLEHHYPLRPGGLNAIIDALVGRCDANGSSREVLHPGRLEIDPERRALRPADPQQFAPRH